MRSCLLYHCWTRRVHMPCSVLVGTYWMLPHSYRSCLFCLGISIELGRQFSWPWRVWHVTAFKFVTTALMKFILAAENGIAGFLWYNPWMGQGGFRLLVPCATGVHRRLDHYGFGSFFLCWSFDSAVAYRAYRWSAEINCSFRGVSPWLFHHSFGHGQVYVLVEAIVLAQKQDVIWTLNAGKAFHDRNIIWSAALADRCIMTSALDHIPPSHRTHSGSWTCHPLRRPSLMHKTSIWT